MPMFREPMRPRILVVEDDAMVRELIVTRLDLGGYHTFEARDGDQALMCLEDVRPAAMVLDINMPRMDGFEVLKHIKATGVLARTPTMVLTARNQPDDVKRAIALGARDFLAKPFHDEQLLVRVARLLRKVEPPKPPGRLPVG